MAEHNVTGVPVQDTDVATEQPSSKKARKKKGEGSKAKKKQATPVAAGASVTPLDFQKANRQTMHPSGAAPAPQKPMSAPAPQKHMSAPSPAAAKGGGVVKISNRAAAVIAAATTGTVKSFTF